MLMVRLLWDRLPDTLPSSGRRRFSRLRDLAAAMTVASLAEAWRAHLAGLLDQDSAGVPGWGPVTVADLDTDLAWNLYELASRARQDAIGTGRAAVALGLPWTAPARISADAPILRRSSTR
jgi:hypothetical protein